MTGVLTFRSIMGGPNSPTAYRRELDRIEAVVAVHTFRIGYDLSLTIGSDMVPVTHSTGTRSIRVKMPEKLAKAAIFINETDTKQQTDHAGFLRMQVIAAINAIIDAVLKKDPTFDATAERADLVILEPG